MRKTPQQDRKRVRQIQRAIEDILNPLYQLSLSIFTESGKRLAEYRETHHVENTVDVPVDVVRNLVQLLFAERKEEIANRSVAIGSKVIRKYTLPVALEAWLFCRVSLVKNKGVVRGVPVIWRALDVFFQQFLADIEREVE